MAKKRSNSGKQSDVSKWLGGVGLIALIGVAVCFMSGCSGGKKDKKNAPSEQTENKAFAKVKVCKVFIENSGSMDGYVASVNSEMKSDLNALLSNAITLKQTGENTPLVDSVALYYINSDLIPIKAKDVSLFAEGLSVQSFQEGGGDRGFTSLQDLIGRVQKETKKGEVSVIVSDMILALSSGQSPASVSTNIETLLRRQLSERPDWSVVVWRMLSDFEGKYYQTGGQGVVSLSGVKRPYYIIFMGGREELRSLLAEGQIPENSSLYRHRTHVMNLEGKATAVDYHIDTKVSLGSFTRDKKDKHVIAKATKGNSKDGKVGFGFDVVVNRPALLQAKADLLKLENYSISPEGYRIASVKEQGNELKLRVEGDGVVRGDFTISYLQQSPHWLEAVHTEQNTNIHAPMAMGQTYGIRYILEGLLRPYESEAKTLFSLDIRIN